MATSLDPIKLPSVAPQFIYWCIFWSDVHFPLPSIHWTDWHVCYSSHGWTSERHKRAVKIFISHHPSPSRATLTLILKSDRLHGGWRWPGTGNVVMMMSMMVEEWRTNFHCPACLGRAFAVSTWPGDYGIGNEMKKKGGCPISWSSINYRNRPINSGRGRPMGRGLSLTLQRHRRLSERGFLEVADLIPVTCWRRWRNLSLSVDFLPTKRILCATNFLLPVEGSLLLFLLLISGKWGNIQFFLIHNEGW